MHNLEKEIADSRKLEAEALDSCNSEPIQIPGTIQSYGALLAFDFDSLEIQYASANLGQFLSFETDVFSLTLRALFAAEDYHAIFNVACHKTTLSQREYVKVITGLNGQLEVSLYRWENLVVLELTPSRSSNDHMTISSHVKWVLDQVEQSATVDEVLNHSVQALQTITGFDRVKAYKFHPDDSGEVVAEARGGVMESYMGLRFPAFDIPPKARELFLKLPIRHIYDTNDSDVLIRAAGHHLPALDQSLGILRGNFPIHMQYLKNMGVRATMTLPIIVAGKLWGLFAHHHDQPLALIAEVSYAAELIGKMVSMILSQKLKSASEAKVNALHLEGHEFVTLDQHKLYLDTFWANYAAKLKSLIKCDGVSYQVGEEVLTYGSCPDNKTILDLVQRLEKDQLMPIYQSTNLRSQGFTDLGTVSGVLTIQVHERKPRAVICFYREAVEKRVTWAGDPEKNIVVDESGVRLHPRSSFKHFEQLNKDHCEIWDGDTLLLAEVALHKFTQVAMTEKQASGRLKLVVHELNHRIRNLLGLVRSISRQSMGKSQSVADYVNALEQRILSLARANNMLTMTANTAVALKSLIEEVVLPIIGSADRVTIEGGTVKLSAQITPTLVLVMHELTTNAIKYGALSMPEGQLSISWHLSDQGLDLIWKERGGPRVRQPEHTGFGTTIIQHALSHETAGSAQMSFDPEGLQVQIQLPEKVLGEQSDQLFAAEQISKAASNGEAHATRQMHVLVLEDDFVNACDLKDLIESFPNVTATLASGTEQALKKLQAGAYQLALLDVNLKNETSLDVALYCEEMRVPFCYITGYGDAFLQDGAFPYAQVIIKPVETQKLKKLISRYL